MTEEGSEPGQPVPRWLGPAALVAGVAVNELTLERFVVPDGEIGSVVLRVGIVVFQLLAVAYGARALLIRPRSRIPWNRLALAAASGLAAWFLCFAAVDTLAPDLLAGTGIPYFEVRGRFAPDSGLVMVPRHPDRERRMALRGDLHDPEDDLPDPAVDYRATYDDRGFRTSGGEPPYELAVFGDSFLEIGERDSLTAAEMLARETGLDAYNFGRGWYGPHHYAELLRRHGVGLRPEFAVLFFFEGNDASDALAYERWRDEGGSYGDFTRVQGPLWKRFRTATLDLLAFLQWKAAEALGLRSRLAAALGGEEPTRPRNTATVRIGGDHVPMKFGYWPDDSGTSAETLLQTPAWRAAERALRRFRDTARSHGIIPVVAFLPTKATTYARQILRLPPRFAGRDLGASAESPPRGRALSTLSDALGLPFFDLTAVLREHAPERPLLFYAQDTHWAPPGRRVAARVLADSLRTRWAGSFEAGDRVPDAPSTGVAGAQHRARGALHRPHVATP